MYLLIILFISHNYTEFHKNYEPDISAHQKILCLQSYAYHTWRHSCTSSYLLLSMNADVLMLSYLLLLSVTRPCIRRILLPASATDIYYSMNPPICQDSYGNFQSLSNNSPSFSGWISASFVYSTRTCSLTSLKRQHIQFFRKNTMRHAIVPHTASALIQRHPDHLGYFWNLQFHRFRFHIFPYVKYFAHLIILKRCPMKKWLRLDPYQSAVI